uniref:K Homology domain-containing protein n=1 Tax=Acrobeloides nanus TaxID=290746 RepID=A0A914C2K0_9BILA
MEVTESVTVLESDAKQIFRDIRKLKDTFKVKILIQQDPLNPGYSTIKTTGRSENAKEAIAYIDANLPRTMSMDIHPDDIGWIIGRSGDNIRSLQNTYKITARFEQNTLHLRGRPADMNKAKEAVKKRIQDKLFIQQERNESIPTSSSNKNENVENSQKKKKYSQLQKDARVRTKEFKQLKNSINKDY